MLTSPLFKHIQKKRLQKKLDHFKFIRGKRGYLTSTELSHRADIRDKLYLLTYGG